MKKSTNKILTTHTGSLPRPEVVQHMLAAQDRGEKIDRVAFEARLREAVKEVVQRQASCGIDVVNDGEMSKISYSTYVKALYWLLDTSVPKRAPIMMLSTPLLRHPCIRQMVIRFLA